MLGLRIHTERLEGEQESRLELGELGNHAVHGHGLRAGAENPASGRSEVGER